MSRDQVIPLSRKARATRLRKELSRWAWPYSAPVVLKQALCCENCSKPLYFLPYLPRIIKLSTFYPFSFILDFIWEPLNLNFCSARVQSLCYGKFHLSEITKEGSTVAQGLARSPLGKRRCPFPFCVALVRCHFVCNVHFGVLWLTPTCNCQPCLDWLCAFLPFFDMIHSLWDPELKQQHYFFCFLSPCSEQCRLVLDLSEGWQPLVLPVPSPVPLPCPVLCPAQVLQQIVLVVSQEKDSVVLFSFKVMQGLVSVHPLQPFYPELTPLPWHQPHKTDTGWAL